MSAPRDEHTRVLIDEGGKWIDFGPGGSVALTGTERIAYPDGPEVTSTEPLGPVVIGGTWDDGAFPFPAPSIRELSVTSTRRFLWWCVAKQRSNVPVRDPIISQRPPAEDGAVRVDMVLHTAGPTITTLSPLWERTLYFIAGLWSR